MEIIFSVMTVKSFKEQQNLKFNYNFAWKEYCTNIIS